MWSLILNSALMLRSLSVQMIDKGNIRDFLLIFVLTVVWVEVDELCM